MGDRRRGTRRGDAAAIGEVAGSRKKLGRGRHGRSTREELSAGARGELFSCMWGRMEGNEGESEGSRGEEASARVGLGRLRLGLGPTSAAARLPLSLLLFSCRKKEGEKREEQMLEKELGIGLGVG